MAPHAGMVALFEKHFFPKWHQVLHSWLTNAPNYDEITKWYTGWKSMFPEQLLNDTAIRGIVYVFLDAWEASSRLKLTFPALHCIQ